MIVTINKAILHVCDYTNGMTSISETELDVHEAAVNVYITKHIEKSYDSETSSRGKFNKTSSLYRAIQGSNDFVYISRLIVEKLHSALCDADNPKPADVLVCECMIGTDKVLAILKLDNKPGYVHQITSNDGHPFNTLSCSPAILPQTINEYAYIINDGENILFSGKTYKIMDERIDVMCDLVLECSCETASSKKAYSSITKTLRSHTSDQVESAVKLKRFMLDTVEENSEAVKPEYTLEELSSKVIGSPSDREDFINANIKAGVIGNEDDKLIIDDYLVKKVNEKMKIVTNTGVEIKFPFEMYNNRQLMEIITNGDGTQSIKFNGIEEIKVK